MSGKSSSCYSRHHGYPQIIQLDNGSEFQSKAIDAWAYAHQMKLDFIRPGKPVEDSFIESFNARVRRRVLEHERVCDAC